MQLSHREAGFKVYCPRKKEKFSFRRLRKVVSNWLSRLPRRTKEIVSAWGEISALSWRCVTSDWTSHKKRINSRVNFMVYCILRWESFFVSIARKLSSWVDGDAMRKSNLRNKECSLGFLCNPSRPIITAQNEVFTIKQRLGECNEKRIDADSHVAAQADVMWWLIEIYASLHRRLVVQWTAGWHRSLST